jgi:flagellin
MRINHNILAINAYNQLSKNSVTTSKTMEKLASGLRINRASDDAAGLGISEKMKAQVRGLSQADRNVLDGVSMVQVADGGLNAIHGMLQRMRELAVQASNDTLTDSDRKQIQQEVTETKRGIDDIAENTMFNNIHLLNGTNSATTSNGSSGGSYQYENVLASPPVDSNGLFLFGTKQGYPTTEMDNNEILVYGAGGTSWPSVKVGENSYVLHGGQSPKVSVVESMSEENGVYKVKYNVKDIDVDVNITQSVNIVNDKYQIKYSIENNSGTDQQIGFLFNIDTKLGSDDYAPFIVDGDAINSESLYTSDDIPESFIVYNDNGTNPELQAHGVLKSTDDFSIIEEPDQFGIGQWTSVDKWDWEPSGSFGDSAYSIWWNERTIKSGDSFEVNTYYGLSVPPTIEDPMETIEESSYDIILQVGSNEGDQYKIQLSDARTESLGIDNVDVNNQEGAQQAIGKIDEAINKVSTERSKWGAYQNGLEHIHNNVSNASENTTTAQSRIADADMAKEMTEFTKKNILNQSAQAMIAQANQLPQGILQLLKG